jgi:hypothetical protein
MPHTPSLVIVEAGARVSFQVGPDDVVLTQRPRESARAFSQRVVARHRELGASGVRLERAFVAVGHGSSSRRRGADSGHGTTDPSSSEELLSARYRVARTLIRGSEATATRELVFLAPSNYADRHELRALASTLEDSLFGGNFRVHVELTTAVKSERTSLQPERTALHPERERSVAQRQAA